MIRGSLRDALEMLRAGLNDPFSARLAKISYGKRDELTFQLFKSVPFVLPRSN